MKNVMKYNIQLTDQDVAVCYGKKAYEKYMTKYHPEDEIVALEDYAGITHKTFDEDRIPQIVVGLTCTKDVYNLKATVVHELSHVVTAVMEFSGLDCDETRSYMLHGLYKEVVIWLDGLLAKEVH